MGSPKPALSGKLRKLFFTLYKLAERGAVSNAIHVSTTELASDLGLSQQTASRHLIELEKAGLIERLVSPRGERIKISPKGVSELRAVYLGLKSVLEQPPATLSLEGRVFSGFGEGRYYISLEGYRRQFVEKLGFDPFPGTLNIRLESSLDIRARRELESMRGILIEGFSNEKRTYGGAKCFRAIINGEVEGAVVLIERTHYDESCLEIISPYNLRERLGLRDGNLVRVEVDISRETAVSD